MSSDRIELPGKAFMLKTQDGRGWWLRFTGSEMPRCFSDNEAWALYKALYHPATQPGDAFALPGGYSFEQIGSAMLLANDYFILRGPAGQILAPAGTWPKEEARAFAAALHHLADEKAVSRAPVGLVDGELSRKAIARIIVSAMQFKEFGHRATQEEIDDHPEGFAEVGDFVSSVGAIELLQRSAEEAADRILALASSTQPDGHQVPCGAPASGVYEEPGRGVAALMTPGSSQEAATQAGDASGEVDVALKEVERLVGVYGGAQANAYSPKLASDQRSYLDIRDSARHELVTAIYSLAAQARAQALEEAAKVAEAEADRLYARGGPLNFFTERAEGAALAACAIRSAGLVPEVSARPAAWMRGVYQPSSPNGPAEYDADFVHGDDKPEGDGWIALFTERAIRALSPQSAPLGREDAEAVCVPDWKIVHEYGIAERAVATAATSSREILDQAIALREKTRTKLLARMAQDTPPTDKVGAAVGGRDALTRTQLQLLALAYTDLQHGDDKLMRRFLAEMGHGTPHPDDGSVKSQDQGGGL